MQPARPELPGAVTELCPKKKDRSGRSQWLPPERSQCSSQTSKGLGETG